MRLLDRIAASLAPHQCLGCAAEGALLCADCLRALPPAPPLSMSGLEAVRARTLYQSRAKQLVWRLKASGAQAAAVTMAQAMLPLIASKNGRPWVVSVPTATSRVRQRGYDQAQLLGRYLARQAHLPWLDCLARSGQFHQVGANRARRQQQLRDSLRVKQARLVHGAHLLLVDDVVTTGATLQAAAAVLRAAGASKIEAVTFAYTMPK